MFYWSMKKTWRDTERHVEKEREIKRSTHTHSLSLNRKYNISHSKNSHTRLANKCGSFFERIRFLFDSWNRHRNNICLWLADSKKNSYISVNLTTNKVSLLFLFRLLFPMVFSPFSSELCFCAANTVLFFPC